MNFIHEQLPFSDRQLFFQEDDAIEFNATSLLDIVTQCSKMSRKSARTAGWDRPIPAGFSQHRVGKTHFWILNIWEGCEK